MSFDMDDPQEPDEARPAKRVRLEAPLEITKDLQDEIEDNEEDWDDIYGLGPDDAAAPEPTDHKNSGVLLPQAEHSAETVSLTVHPGEAPEDGIPADAVEDTGDIDLEQTHVAITDAQSAKIVAETTHVDVESPYHLDSPTQVKEDVNGNSTLERSQEEAEVGNTSADNTVEEQDGEAHAPPTELLNAPPRPHEDREFLEAAAAQKDDQNAEWQFNSSDAESSDSDSDSSYDDSDDSESGSEGGYELLDPATAAKMLMAGDADDDDGDKSKEKSNGDHQPRTANEVKDEVVPKPEVVVTADMKITHLGAVDGIVDSQILIKAATPGEYRVLEYGSVLCTEDRQVIGAVADTIGRVQQPLYSVAFTNSQEIADAGLEFGTKVFYVDSHSTFVFTQPLKNMKGTDASNIHDEEVGEDELEFSDDEQEAEYKRLRKLAKKEGKGTLSRGAYNEAKASGNIGAPMAYDRSQTYNSRSDAPQQQYGSGINYDDGDVQEEFYSPLRRPENLSQLMAGGGPPPKAHAGNFDRGRGRGRGDRGRGRGDRGRGRGGFDHRNQRGGRGNFDRGGRGQQNGHRGVAHSYPDRHNESRTSGQSPPARSSPSQASPNQPSRYPQYQSQPPPQQQPPSPQTYQFNGYTFLYGNPPPQQQVYHQQQSHAIPTPNAYPPSGAYVNPAFYQNQQQWSPTQAQASYAPWPQQNQQPPTQQPQYPNAGYAQQSYQQPDLGAILRQLGGQSR